MHTRHIFEACLYVYIEATEIRNEGPPPFFAATGAPTERRSTVPTPGA